MSNQWSEAKLFKFLRFYKSYECLWNPYSPEYQNYDAKSNAFSQILCEMNDFGLTVDKCLIQIKYIRKTYKQEQQKLENIALLGGRAYSNLLWYPLMNSMFSKVIRDEEKANQESRSLNLMAVPKRLRFNSGDQLARRNLQERSMAIYGETTAICPYIPNSNQEDYTDDYPNSIVPINCVDMCVPNEHISCCPTCGFLRDSYCNCHSINDIGCSAENFNQSYISQSQIDYRPKTSYNYRNGVLEINSAVRIPVSQPLKKHGRSHVIESTTLEAPKEYNFKSCSSNRQTNYQNNKDDEELSVQCNTKSVQNNENSKIADEYSSPKILDRAVNINSNTTNSQPNKNGVSIRNIRGRLKKSRKNRGSVDKIVRAKNLLGLIGTTPISTCKNIKHNENCTGGNKANDSNLKKLNDNLESEQSIDLKSLTNTKQPIVALDSNHQRNVDIIDENTSKKNVPMADMKIEIDQVSTTASENNGYFIKENISVESPQGKIEYDQVGKNIKSGNLKVELSSGQSEKSEALNCVLNEKRFSEKIDDLNQGRHNVEDTENLKEKSKSMMKYKLAKIVIDFIDETLSKPGKGTTEDHEERLILKKVAEDLKAVVNESNPGQYRNHMIKPTNKTICWRQPIAERCNIIPCKVRSSVCETNYIENISCGKSVQSNNRDNKTHKKLRCFRMMAGADSGVERNTNKSNSFTQHKGIAKNGRNVEVSCNKVCQTNSPENIPEIKCMQPNEITISNHSVCKISQCENPQSSCINYAKSYKASNLHGMKDKSFRPKGISNKKYPDLDLRAIEIGGKIKTKQSELMAKDNSEKLVSNSNICNSDPALQDIMRVENCITTNISVNASESTENSALDKVVKEITDCLQKTLNKNGYAIENKNFFSKKSLITSGNGEISSKVIENETVWKTELRNIVGDLMNKKNTENPITFKVKTMILPVMDESVTEVATSTLSQLNTKNEYNISKNTPLQVCEAFANEHSSIKDTECSRSEHKLFAKDDEKRPKEGRDFSTYILKSDKNNYKITPRQSLNKSEKRTCNVETNSPNSAALFHKLCPESRSKNKILPNLIKRYVKRSKRMVPIYSNKILINEANRIVLSNNDHLNGLRKLLKYLEKFERKFHTIPKKNDIFLQNRTPEKKYAASNDEEFVENQINAQEYPKNDFTEAKNIFPQSYGEDISVYLCTEISQNDETEVQKATSCDDHFCRSISHDVNRSSFFTNQENKLFNSTLSSCSIKFLSRDEMDFSEWESFSESDVEAGMIELHGKHRNSSSLDNPKRHHEKNFHKTQLQMLQNSDKGNKDSASYSTAPPKQTCSVNTMTETGKKQFWYCNSTDDIQILNNIVSPFSEGRLQVSEANLLKNISNVQHNYSRNDMNINQKDISDSEKHSKVSSCCLELEDTRKINESVITSCNESEKGRSLLEAKLRIAAKSHIKSCCNKDVTSSICTPICDVTSRLRLCAIMKPPNEYLLANNSDILSDNTCYCESMRQPEEVITERDLKLHRKASQRNAIIGDANVKSMSATCQTELLKSERNVIERQTQGKIREPGQNLNGTLQIAEKETNTSATTISNITTSDEQGNTKNSVSTSLDLTALRQESVLLEIKMLQPLFSIELRKAPKHIEKLGLTNFEESAVESSTEKCTMTDDVNLNSCNATTPPNSINKKQTETDRGTLLLIQKNVKDIFSSTIESSNSKPNMENNDNEIKVSKDQKESLSEQKKNASTNFQGNSGGSDLNLCNMIPPHVVILSKKYEDSGNQSDTHKALMNDCSVDCANKAIPLSEINSCTGTESMTIETIIKSIETCLQRVTDPVLREELVGIVKYINNQNQNNNYSSRKNHTQLSEEAPEYLRSSVEANGTSILFKYEDDNERQSHLPITENSQCGESCKSSEVTVATRSFENDGGIDEDNHTLIDRSEIMLSYENKPSSMEKMSDRFVDKETSNQTSGKNREVHPDDNKSCFQSKSLIIPIAHSTLLSSADDASENGELNISRSEWPFSKLTQRVKSKNPSMISVENQGTPYNELNEIKESRDVIKALNYSSKKIYCDVQETRSYGSSCDESIDEELNSTPLAQNHENDESKHRCCSGQPTEINIDAFTTSIATQLQGLSIEAALRFQQRIQDLISESYLEEERSIKTP